MTQVDPERLSRLTAELRALRERLDDPADEFVWEIDLYTYDQVLVAAADMLDVPLPPGAREEMGTEARRELEEALAGAGLEVTAGDVASFRPGEPDPPPRAGD